MPAPPVTQKRRRPPVLARTLERRMRSATRQARLVRPPGLPVQVEVAHHPVAGGAGPAEDHALGQAARGEGVPHLGVDLLEDPRHGHEHGGPDLQEVLGQGDEALGVVDGDAQVEHRVVPAGALEDVGQGQDARGTGRPARGAGPRWPPPPWPIDVGGQVALGEHGPLGVPGGARGVDEGEQVLGACAPWPRPAPRPGGPPGPAPSSRRSSQGRSPARRRRRGLARPRRPPSPVPAAGPGGQRPWPAARRWRRGSSGRRCAGG